MKRAILFSGIVALMLSCNSNRITELEKEIVELKTSVELCRQEADRQRALAEIARIRAIEAQQLAEERAQKDTEDTKK